MSAKLLQSSTDIVVTHKKGQPREVAAGFLSGYIRNDFIVRRTPSQATML